VNEDWKFIKEVHSFKELPSDQIPEFIFWGRSNVGKSSLINSLTKKRIAKTSRTPGRTKSLVFFQFKNILRIVDFPGYGFSKISANQIIKLDLLLDQYFQKRKNLKKIFLYIIFRLALSLKVNFVDSCMHYLFHYFMTFFLLVNSALRITYN